jgi:hypothetical protein
MLISIAFPAEKYFRKITSMLRHTHFAFVVNLLQKKLTSTLEDKTTLPKRVALCIF